MLITSLPDRRVGDQVVIAAQVDWEDCDRKNRVVYACVPGELAETAARGEWLLLSTILIAARYGERRVMLDRPVDPLLRRGVGYALGQLRLWYGGAGISIEAETRTRSHRTDREARVAGLFVSGGVDSWASFLRNREEVPASHAASFASGLRIDWMGPSDPAELGDHLRVTGTRWRSSRSGQAFAAAGLDVLTVVTNTRRLDGNVFHRDWMFSDHGAMFSALAHLLTGLLWSVSIASTYDLAGLGPWGSHPLLDPWYGSTDLRILHDSPDLSRMDKLGALADRRDLVEALDVCVYWFQRQESDAPNCGRCEKCLRTLFGLEAAGVGTQRLPNFEPGDVVGALESIEHFQDQYEKSCWSDILARLEHDDHPWRRPVRHLLDRTGVRGPAFSAAGR